MILQNWSGYLGRERVRVVEYWPEGSHVQAGAHYVIEREGGERARVAAWRITK